jgi:chromosome transmission fidelity protein 1
MIQLTPTTDDLIFQISDLRSQLFPQVDNDRFVVFQCGHIVPKDNLTAIVINKGPAGSALEFKMASREDKALVIYGLQRLTEPFANIRAR